MRRAHLYAIVFGLGVLGLSGTAVFVGLFALIVPGLVLLGAPTAALYLPVTDALFTSVRRRRWLLFAAAAATAAIAFIVIPSRVNDRLSSDIAAAQKGDFGASDIVSPGRLFLVADTDRAGLGACGETCARLLVEKHVEEIIVPLDRADGNPNLVNGFEGRVAIYRLQAGTVCPPLHDDQLSADREILAQIGAGACITRVTADDSDFDAALVARRNRQKPVEPLNPFASGVVRIERRTLWRCRAGQCEKTLHQTTVEAERLVVPISIGLGSSGSSMIREFSRTSITANARSNFGVLGLAVPGPTGPRTNALRPPLSAAEGSRARQAALTILDATTRAPRELTAPEAVIVNQVLEHLRDTPGLGDDDHRLLRAVLAHRDLDGLIFPNVFQVRPALRDALAPELVQAFERLSSGGSFKDAHDRSEIAKELGLLSDEAFMSHKAGILRAFSRPSAIEHSDQLPIRLGDYGEDALPLLTAALRDDPANYRVVLGICRIGGDASPLADHFGTLQRSAGQRQSWERRAAALALKRMGRTDLIRVPPLDPLAFRRSLELRAWYKGLKTVTPNSPPSVCSDGRVRLSH